MAGAKGLFGMQDKGWTDAAGLSMQGLQIQSQAEAAKTKQQKTTTTYAKQKKGALGGMGSTIGSVVGGIAGTFMGGNTMLGATLGGALGGALDGGGEGAAGGAVGGLATGLSMETTGAADKMSTSIGNGFNTLMGSLGFGGAANGNAANRSLLDTGSKNAFNDFYKGNMGSIF